MRSFILLLALVLLAGCGAGGSTADTSTPVLAPDLSVVSISTNPDPPVIGSAFNLVVLIRNVGLVAAGPTVVSVYQKNTTDPAFVLIASSALGSSVPGAGFSYTVPETALGPAITLVKVVVTPLSGETNTANNTSTFTIVPTTAGPG